jgi:hypothetical protein
MYSGNTSRQLRRRIVIDVLTDALLVAEELFVFERHEATRSNHAFTDADRTIAQVQFGVARPTSTFRGFIKLFHGIRRRTALINLELVCQPG